MCARRRRAEAEAHRTAVTATSYQDRGRAFPMLVFAPDADEDAPPMSRFVSAARPGVMRRPWRRLLRTAAVAAVVIAASAEAGPPVDTRIVLRLDARYFAAGNAVRPATVDVAHEVREVVGRRHQHDVGRQVGVPFEAGTARMRVDLPTEAAAFPAAGRHSAIDRGLTRKRLHQTIERIGALHRRRRQKSGHLGRRA